METHQARELLKIICADDYGRQLLASLTLLEHLPASETWFEFLQNERDRADWQILAKAVAYTLDHQSQEATDCRWLKVMFFALKGEIVFPAGKFDGDINELLKYPEAGDLRKVRPTIRAMEGGLALTTKTTDWPQKFWTQCLRDTTCSPLHLSSASPVNAGTTAALVSSAYRAVVHHANHTRHTIATDAKHDVTFATGLFALSVLQDLLRIGVGQSILGRLGLRTLLECFVTLAYLAKEDLPQLWESYRIYGAGQAKLAFLKLDDAEAAPAYIGVDTLNSLANEDMWQEFISMDLGHWDRSNLRTLSEKAGVKQEYDKFYPWTSTYAHGHWAALRDSVFIVCGNPLHRLHRIPRQSARVLEDVIPDACELVDRILGLIEHHYPGLQARVSAPEPMV